MLLLRQAVCAPRKCRISYGCAGVLTSLLHISDGVGVIAKIESINALSDALRRNGHKGFAQCSDGSGFRTVWVGSWVLPNYFLNTQLTSTAPNNHGAFSVQKILGFWSFFFRLSTPKLRNIQPGLSSFPESFSGESPRGDFSELGGMLSSEQMAATTEKIPVDEGKGVTHIIPYFIMSCHIIPYHHIPDEVIHII